jgi:predicted Fe-S protein YdhL (DUF1289 family)
MTMADTRDPPTDPVPSPCVRRCCLDENDICMGCFRSMAEIMRWNEADDAERREIVARCREREGRRRSQIEGGQI